MKTLISFFAATFLIVSSAIAQFIIPPNRPVIVKITSTDCNVCGLGAWDELKEAIDLYERKAVIMAVHPFDFSQLFSETSLSFAENMPSFFGTPTFYVNTTMQPFNFWLSNAKEDIKAFQEGQVVAYPAINYAIEGEALKVEVDIEYFKRVTRSHHVSVFVLEDQVTQAQAARSIEDKHSKVLRTHMGEAVFGATLSAQPIEKGQTFTNNYSLTLDESWNPDELEIAVIIWERNGENYSIENSNAATIPTALSTTSTNFLEAAQVELSIQPTILVDATTVNVSSPTDLKDVNLNIVNMLGQTIQTVFSGDLNKGNRSFSLNKNEFNAAGLYFLVLEKGGSKLTQKVIVK